MTSNLYIRKLIKSRKCSINNKKTLYKSELTNDIDNIKKTPFLIEVDIIKLP